MNKMSYNRTLTPQKILISALTLETVNLTHIKYLWTSRNPKNKQISFL